MKTFTVYFTRKHRHSLQNGLKLLILFILIASQSVHAQFQKKRTYADFQGAYEYGTNAVVSVPKGVVSNDALAADGDVKTASSLSVGIAALNLSGATQYLEFTTDGTHANKRLVTANTPVTVKLKLPTSIANVAGGITLGTFTGLAPVAASNPALGTSNNAGYDASSTTQYFSTAELVTLLNSAGEVEVTFTPTTAYNGVYLKLTSILGVGLSANLYHAYILDDGTTDVACDSKIDALAGVGSYVTGLNLATVLGSVTNQYGPVDGTGNGIATLAFTAVSANSYLYHTTVFKTESKIGDAVSLRVRTNGGVIDVGVLKNSIAVQTFNRGVAGAIQQGGSSLLLSVQLLNGGTEAVITYVPTTVFDRVQLRVGSFVDVNIFSSVDLLSVAKITPAPTLTTSDFTIYSGHSVDLTATPSSSGDGVVWTPGGSGSSINTGTLTTGATATDKLFDAQTSRAGCTNLSANATATVHVLPLPTYTDPTSVIEGKSYNTAAGKKVTLAGGQSGSTYTYTTVTPLPAGLTLNPDGTITGTPGPGTGTSTPVSFSADVFDVTLNLPVVSGQSFSITVFPPIALIGVAFPVTDQTKTDYTADLKVIFNGPATGGLGTGYQYYLTPQVIPGGRTAATLDVPTDFTLSPAGILTGNPFGQAGSYTFDVYANDGEQQTSATFTLLIREAPLPVTLTVFKATKEGSSVLLSWTTTSETNSERFDLERSNSGKEWTVIGTKLSKGESAQLVNYSLTDGTPLSGENLYRLKMIDFDGTFAYSKIESLNFGNASASVYPNPVTGSENIQITVEDWNKVKSVRVVSQAGKVVFESNNALSTGINTRNLSNGLYVVQVMKTNGTVATYKIAKQ